jgi:hypothetical protein
MLPDFPGEHRASRRDWIIPGTCFVQLGMDFGNGMKITRSKNIFNFF